ncbi:MAG: hypothetical protein DWQ36_18025 [Acidobacteria bacterium]|nr:MAG: hypothetical protein DWQ30_15525 [Acidobacteriota bacterium]REK04332.1 MAG: hypothetical protein DWQ36_18025 [Acidobacteriota bacterium]
MISELFSVGPISISPFGLLLVLALFSAFAQLRWGMRRLGIGDDDAATSLLLAAAVGGIVGGKLYYALLYQDLSLVLQRAGIVFYGSLIGGALAVSWMIVRRGLPYARTADAVAPAVALGYAVGRIGCLLVGDDYGRPTELPWGMTFPEGPIPTTASALQSQFGVEVPPGYGPLDQVPVHPTQIYETLSIGLLWLLARRWTRRDRRAGELALIVFAAMAIERFLIEFLRAKDDRFLAGLTVAQAISLAILLLVVVLWTRLPPRSADRGEASRSPARGG